MMKQVKTAKYHHIKYKTESACNTKLNNCNLIVPKEGSEFKILCSSILHVFITLFSHK